MVLSRAVHRSAPSKLDQTQTICPNLNPTINWNKDDGIAESIILEILSEMNERQIQSYMILLSKDHRKELSSIYETFKNPTYKKEPSLFVETAPNSDSKF